MSIAFILALVVVEPSPVAALPTIPASATAAPLVVKPDQHAVAPKGVLDRYEARMLSVHTPVILTFEYTVEQAGTRSVTVAHRIYRSGSIERDETIGIDEAKIKPRIRIYRNRPDAYAFESVAPRKDMYAFTFVAKVRTGNHVDYVYRTAPLNHLNAFTVTSVVIDGTTFLPAAIDFTTVSATATGSGTLRYADVDGAWVISEAEASAITGKKKLREHFVFTGYHFPKSLPASTFGPA